MTTNLRHAYRQLVRTPGFTATAIATIALCLCAKLAHGEEVKLAADRKAISVQPDILQSYVGTYEFQPGLNYFVTLDGNQLMGRLGTQPSFPLYPETPTYFFLKVVDAQIEFVKNANGSVASVILHQGGRDHTMTRKSSTVKAPPGHKEIKVQTEILQRYVGSYQLGPHVEIVVTLEDDQLGAQLTGQQRFPIFPESENKFFFKVVEAQLEFVRDSSSSVKSVILHQNGIDQTAVKE